jgi:hypothetical protein
MRSAQQLTADVGEFFAELKTELRERVMGQAPTGAAALGAAGNPTALALARENTLAHQDEDAASQYESDLRGEDLYQRTGNATGLMSLDFNRRMGLLSTASGMSQFQTGARIQTQPQPTCRACSRRGSRRWGASWAAPVSSLPARRAATRRAPLGCNGVPAWMASQY